MPNRIAYMPLATYPGPLDDKAILAAARFAGALDCRIRVTAFCVRLPGVHSPMASMLIDVPSLARTLEDRSRSEADRLKRLLEGWSAAGVQFAAREVMLGAEPGTAAAEARYHELAILPWSGETVSAQEISEAVVFGSGRPAILVPPAARSGPLDHIAIAWDESRVAARALGDALSLLSDGGTVSVLTVGDEKPLKEADIAAVLASALGSRGIKAKSCRISLAGRDISDALQEAAIGEGAKLLAMGGFGHSRLRDFVLGGATRGVLGNLSLPVLLSH
jgi:nucleotide-binding universal stress UspA family protein